MIKKSNKPLVFLGGTCATSTWRDQIIPQLNIDYFDPRVEEWNDIAYQAELDARKNADYCVYVLTPEMKGVYSVAEIIDDSNKHPEKTIFCFLNESNGKTFEPFLIKNMEAIAKMIIKNNATWVKNLDELVEVLNSSAKKLQNDNI